MGSIEVADADPTLPCELVVASASFIFGGRPAVHFPEQIHQGKGSLDGRFNVWRCLTAFFSLAFLNRLPSCHHAAYVLWVHGAVDPGAGLRPAVPHRFPKDSWLRFRDSFRSMMKNLPWGVSLEV